MGIGVLPFCSLGCPQTGELFPPEVAKQKTIRNYKLYQVQIRWLFPAEL